MNIFTICCNNQLERMNMGVDEDTGKHVGIMNGTEYKIRRFLINKFWEKIGCLISAPTFGIGGLRLW